MPVEADSPLSTSRSAVNRPPGRVPAGQTRGAGESSQPPEPRHSVGVKDVAIAAGVSLGTVSNVLNRPDRVSEATRERVLKAVRELGFVRNESARTLRAGRSRVLAYVMLDATNPFFTDVARAMEGSAESADLTLFLCDSGNRAEREQAHLDRLVEQRVAGIMVTAVDPGSPRLLEVSARGVPLVVVDRVRDDDALCSVAVDDHLGGRLAVEHLVERGHRRIAFVGGPLGLGQVADRLAGAREAWATAGRAAADLTVIDTPALTVTHGLSACEALLAQDVDRRPTAAFCANDLVALGVLQGMVGREVSVPGELAIIGYDDIEFAGAAAVPLTSVRQPRADLGRTATELLLAEGEGTPHTHRRVVFEPEVVARASTRTP
ncbi:LacI family transcriptional regulator [Nocardioidaceae bacterium]|nr:LacI family transcriptional regulator [Nocardioidaceae bacterium]